MSRENVEIVRIYDAWAQQASARALIGPDMGYVNPPYAVEPGTTRDRRPLAKVREVYPDFRIEPERYIHAGDDVVVTGTARGTSANGVEAEWRQGYVWRIRDGRAVRLRWFDDPREALEAVGLRE